MFISGILQIGIGVSNVHEAFTWYRQCFGIDVPIFDDAATAGLMLPYTGGTPQDRHAILAYNLQGGGGAEIWQYTSRVPESPSTPPTLGDLGIFIAKIKCKNVHACYQDLKKRGAHLLGEPCLRPNGQEHFFVKDPWGNPFEIVACDEWFSRKLPNHTGGMLGCVIGVSDMNRALAFYQETLGYDSIVYDQTEQFADWQGLDGSDGVYRRVLLRHSAKRPGPFCRLIGDSEIELVQNMDAGRTPKHIYQDRLWGDLGFIHLCYDVTGMAKLKEFFASKGHPFTVDSSGKFDMGEAAGHFAYVEDPDGTLIEFVETHKIPILKKLKWYLHLNSRPNPIKPLPDWMIKALGFGRVK